MPRPPYTVTLTPIRNRDGSTSKRWQLRGTLRRPDRPPRRIKRVLDLPASARKGDAADAAAALWRALEAESTANQPAPGDAAPNPTLAALLEWDAERADAAPATRRLVRKTARAISRHLGEEALVGAIGHGRLEAYQRARSAEGVANRTINLELRSILMPAWRRAHAAGLAPAPPAPPRKLPEEHKLPRWLSLDELGKLVRALQQPAPSTRDPNAPPRGRGRAARTMLAESGRQAADAVIVLASTGIRRSEFMGSAEGDIAGFRWRDVDWDRKILRVPSRKRGGSTMVRWREVALSAAALGALERRLAETGEERGSEAPAWRYMHKLRHWLPVGARQAGLREASKLRIHDLRHTYATLALQSGSSVAEVAAALGDNIATVAKTYLHAPVDAGRKAADVIGSAMVSGCGGVDSGKPSESREGESGP